MLFTSVMGTVFRKLIIFSQCLSATLLPPLRETKYAGHVILFADNDGALHTHIWLHLVVVRKRRPRYAALGAKNMQVGGC